MNQTTNAYKKIPKIAAILNINKEDNNNDNEDNAADIIKYKRTAKKTPTVTWNMITKE